MECQRRFMAVVDVGGKKFAVQISSLFVNPPTIAPDAGVKKFNCDRLYWFSESALFLIIQ